MAAFTKNRVPKYRQHAASGQARVTLGARTHYLGVFGSPESREKYDRLIAEWLTSGRQTPRPVQDDSLSISEVLLAYDDFAIEYYANSPYELVKIRIALRPLRDLYGRTAIKTFDSLALEAVQQRLVDTNLA